MRYAILFLVASQLTGQVFKNAAPLVDNRQTGTAPFEQFANVGALPATDAVLCATAGAYADILSPGALYRNSGTGGTCTWSIVTGGGGGTTTTCGVGTFCINTTGNTQVVTSADVPLDGNINGSLGLSPLVCVDATGSTTAYLPSCGVSLASYNNGQTLFVVFAASNTTAAPTINIDTLGVRTLKCADGSPLIVGAIKPFYAYTGYYDGSFERINACGSPNDTKVFAYEVGSENAAAVFVTADLTNHNILINDTKAKTLTEASCVSDVGSQAITVKIGGTTLFSITCVPNGSYSRSTTNGTTGYILAASMTTTSIGSGAQVDMSGTATGTTKDIKLHAWGTIN